LAYFAVISVVILDVDASADADWFIVAAQFRCSFALTIERVVFMRTALFCMARNVLRFR